MTEKIPLRGFSKQDNPEKLSVISLLILPLIGIFCIILPEPISEILPLFVGIAMVISAIGGIIAAVKKIKDTNTSIGSSLVIGILGIITLLYGESSINFIGVLWGFLGLISVAQEIDSIVRRIREKKPFVLSLLWNIFKLVLSLLLIVDPFANIAHHVIVLGLELVTFPFHLHRKNGKVTISVS